MRWTWVLLFAAFLGGVNWWLYERSVPGQIVTIGGDLVDVRGPGGFSWNTSLIRTDTGDGACEIVWVERLETR